MKFNITQKQYKTILKENSLDEASRSLNQKQKEYVYNLGQDYAKDVYGDEFDTEDEKTAEHYKLPGYKKNVDIKGGMFSVGNQKLSPDTLIINFTAAFTCPSRRECPVTQCACYAVAGENRLKDTRSKNIKVDKLVKKAYVQNKLPEFFNIAKKYIEMFSETNQPIKWVRFNEAGDFLNQKTVDLATQFAKDVYEQYGVKCMAYTAKPWDYREASKYIAINASTNKIFDKMDPSSPKRNFFAVNQSHFDYDFIGDKYDAEYEEYKIKHNLKKSKKAQNVQEKIVEKLPANGTTNDITVPILQYGRWGSGEEEQGYYYICPCSFWKDRKNQIELPYCKAILDTPPYNIKHLREVYPKVQGKNGKMYDHPVVRKLMAQLNKVQSPCGISCAVCHDRKGGIDKNSGKIIKDYAILNGTHGPSASNFNPKYADAKRKGDNSVKYSEENPYGEWKAPGLENRGDKKG